MSRSIHLYVLAIVMTVADLAVFIHCTPILCQAWGSHRWFLCCLFAGIIVWAESLANLWRTAIRSRQQRQSSGASIPLLSLPTSEEGSNPNV